MCGVFGGIGHRINQNIIRSLALSNRDRGTDALGFFASDNTFIKRGGEPLDFLAMEDCSDWLERRCLDAWFVAGHTRAGTRGHRQSSENAHPFTYGNYRGCHNGVVDAPMSYDVDSMWLIDLLHKHSGDYKEAFKDVGGSWTLIWTDTRSLFLQACGNPLAAATKNGVVYYSSDKDHLLACIGHVDKVWEFSDGDTWSYSPEGPEGNIQTKVLDRFHYSRKSVFSSGGYGMGFSWKTDGYDSGHYPYRQPYSWEPGGKSESKPKDGYGPSSQGQPMDMPVSMLTKKERRKLKKQLRKKALSLSDRLELQDTNHALPETYLFTSEEEKQWEELERVDILEGGNMEAIAKLSPSDVIELGGGEQLITFDSLQQAYYRTKTGEVLSLTPEEANELYLDAQFDGVVSTTVNPNIHGKD